MNSHTYSSNHDLMNNRYNINPNKIEVSIIFRKYSNQNHIQNTCNQSKINLE